ncbi:MAG: STAS domain-containing protein [Spirochaetes bacterium]|nr:STAS domain-containing protein [Spirochaetota bacterium]
MTGQLNISITRNGTATIINMSGQLSVITIKDLETSFITEMGNHPKTITMNLMHVDFIDSNAISLLVRLQKNANARNIRFLLYDPNHAIREILEAVRLAKFFTLITSEEYQSLSPPA